jgi:TonB family protein
MNRKSKSLIPFFILSLLIHLTVLSLINWTLNMSPSTISQKEKKLVKKKEIAKRKPIYVKILDIPKPKKEEKPEKSHIIAQYSMKHKGPKGKQERSSLSGESNVLNYQPGLPITPPKPRITLVPGQKPVNLPKLAQKKPEAAGKEKKGKQKEGSKATKKGKGKQKSPGKKATKTLAKKPSQKQTAQLQPQTSPSTKIVPPLPKRKIPLFDPNLINEQSHRIVPQFGEGKDLVISLDTTKSKYISYFKHIRDKLYIVWRYPLAARNNGVQGTARILFVIDRSGELKEVRLLETSGSSILDKEALRAIRAAGPFGPFPSDWIEKELRISARFIYRLFGGSPFR